MPLIPVILAIAIVGFIVWVVLQIPMPQIFKNIIIGVVALALIIWLLQMLGVATGLPSFRLK